MPLWYYTRVGVKLRNDNHRQSFFRPAIVTVANFISFGNREGEDFGRDFCFHSLFHTRFNEVPLEVAAQ